MKRIFANIQILLFFSVLLFTLNIEEVDAINTIYIRTDGSIDPVIANVTTSDNVIYTFMDNIYDSIVVQRDNIIIDGCAYTVESRFGNDTIGVDLRNRNNVTLKDVQINNFEVGIYLNNSRNNIIKDCKISNNRGDGIYLEWSSDNTIMNNSIANNNVEGIYLSWSSGNDITSNNFTSNGWGGIYLEWSSDNTITSNNFANNVFGSISLDWCHDNTLFHNNFINNGVSISINSTASWDDGYPSGGNYWSDYVGVDLDHDGIGDTPLELGGNNLDHFPLMGVFSSFNTSSGEGVTVVSNSTLEQLQYFGENHTITLRVSNKTGNQTHGFCRACIPYSVINASEGPIAVIIKGGVTPILHFNNSLFDNGTHRWIYFAYEHSTLEIVIIPEYSAPILLATFLIITFLITLLYRENSLSNN